MFFSVGLLSIMRTLVTALDCLGIVSAGDDRTRPVDAGLGDCIAVCASVLIRFRLQWLLTTLVFEASDV